MNRVVLTDILELVGFALILVVLPVVAALSFVPDPWRWPVAVLSAGVGFLLTSGAIQAAERAAKAPEVSS